MPGGGQSIFGAWFDPNLACGLVGWTFLLGLLYCMQARLAGWLAINSFYLLVLYTLGLLSTVLVLVQNPILAITRYHPRQCGQAWSSGTRF